MTTRERNLATIVVAGLLGIGGVLLAKSIILDPMRDLDDQQTTLDRQIARRGREIADEQNYVSAVERLSPRLAQWRKLSLPVKHKDADAPKGPPNPEREAEENRQHLSRVRDEYQRILKGLLASARFKERLFKPIDLESRTTAAANSRAKPVYQVFSYTVEGEADLLGLVDFFEGLYKTHLLHQIKQFSITSMRTSNALDVKMTIEALMVNGAETITERNEPSKKPKDDKKDPRKDGKKEKDDKEDKDRKKILPTFDPEKNEKPPVVLATNKRNYRNIALKNPFVPAAEPTAKIDPPPTDGVINPALSQALPAIELNFIGYSDYYGGWITIIRNQRIPGDSPILIDKPLPKDSRYQREKKDAEARKAAGPTEPVTHWAIRDARTSEPLMELEVVRIDPLRIIVKAEGELYSVAIGSYLVDAFEHPLAKDEVKKLGLAGNKDDVLKKVMLTRLEFKKDRKGYEGHFLNPSYRDEKMVMATEMLPEEFDAPDTWSIRDSSAAEVMKIKVVKTEKDRVIFTSDKKYYSIKVGVSLLDAMAKPLTDDEVKALKLPGS